MQMIDVLKRLAELDATNPNVETTVMAQEQSLGTITNIEGAQLNECGMMGGMDSMRHHTPATLNITADNGSELTGMLKDLMSLAGVKPVADHPAFGGKTMIGSPQPAELDKGGDIQKALSVIDSMNSEEEALEGQEDRVYDNSPEEEIEAHDYGDKQVTPKPQGLKQRQGDNPYKPVGEDIESVSLRLMKEYQEFVNQSK